MDGNATKGPREAVEEFSAGDITALSKFYEEVKKILGRKK